MKKTLLLQTALVAAAGLFVADIASAQVKAEPISVTVGGYMNRSFKVQDREKRAGTATTDRTPATFGAPDSEIWFNIRAVLDNGLKVGGRIELEGATENGGSADAIDETYMWFENDSFGRAEIGSTDRVASKMSYFAPQVIPGYGSGQAAAENAAFILVPGGGATGNRAGGISMWFANAGQDTDGLNLYTASNRYFGSKVGKGLQLGYSYIPDGCQDYQNSGTATSQGAATNGCDVGFGFTNNAGQLHNNHQVAANYLESFGAFDLALHAAYVTTQTEGFGANPIGGRGRVDGWQASTNLTFNVGDGSTVTFGGGYKSEEFTTLIDRKAFNVGLRYLTNGVAPGSIGIGAEYFRAKGEEVGTADDTVYAAQLGLTYQLAAGILMYGGVVAYEWKDGANAAALEAKSTAGVLGARLDF